MRSPLEPDFHLQVHSDPAAAPAPAVPRPHLALDCAQCNVVGLTGAAVFVGGYLATLVEYGKAMGDASRDPGQALFVSPVAAAVAGGGRGRRADGGAHGGPAGHARHRLLG